jgi:RAB6A-GEF complex partner protein 1
LHHVLLVYLQAAEVKEAVLFATHYQNLVFFAHALEILLHTVVESEAESSPDKVTDKETEAEDKNSEKDKHDQSQNGSETETVLPAVVEFLDHFDAALDVVVGCARKTEVTRWRRLFSIVGNPKVLFEVSLFYQREHFIPSVKTRTDMTLLFSLFRVVIERTCRHAWNQID